MPSAQLDFRMKCGCFIWTFISFMAKRVAFVVKMAAKVLTVHSVWTGLLLGFVLSYLSWGNLLLLMAGDVERNPGPTDNTGPSTNLRQTSLRLGSSKDRNNSASGGGGRWPSPSRPVPDNPTVTALSLDDIMTKLIGMENSVHSKLDSVIGDVADIKNRIGEMKEDIDGLQHEVEGLRQENKALWNRIGKLERKTDDLENRSKRRNLLFYGLEREEGETSENCRQCLNNLFTEKLGLVANVEMDRVHRVSNRPNSPIIASCTFYKDKVFILKAKNKLKGSKIFIGEDYSESVRDVRKRLSVFVKKERAAGKKVMMAFDHVFIDGKRFGLSDDQSALVEIGERMGGVS